MRQGWNENGNLTIFQLGPIICTLIGASRYGLALPIMVPMSDQDSLGYLPGAVRA